VIRCYLPAAIDLAANLFGMVFSVARGGPDAHLVFMMPGSAAIKPPKRVSVTLPKVPARREGVRDGGLNMFVGMFLHRLSLHVADDKWHVDRCQRLL